MKTRTDILNLLAERYGYQSFLEIGVKSGINQVKVNVPFRIGVDPDPKTPAIYHETSDDFFAHNQRFYDLIFVDGNHDGVFAQRDVVNSFEHLHPNGTIVMHDCNPPDEWSQRPAAEFMGKKGERWNGTAWKAYAYLRMTRPDLSMCVVNLDEGVGILQRGEQLMAPKRTLNWKFLDDHRQMLLNLIEPGQLENWLTQQDQLRGVA